MIVRLASEQDAAGFIVLAGEVEHWFGAMVDPGFRTVIDRHIRRATALLAVIPGETDLLGGLLFSAQPPTYPCNGWSSPSTRAGEASAAPS